MFILKINTGNSAFEGFSAHEVARLLRAVARRVESGEDVDGNIFDLNGNKCGSWCLEAEEE